jgi:hypothetical protein
VGILDVTPSRGCETIEYRFCCLSALALDASASMAAVGTSDTTQDAECTKWASAEHNFDSGSDALRNRDQLALIAGLPASFRESEDRRESALAANKTPRGDTAWAFSMPQNGSKPVKSPFLSWNMTVTDELIWRVSCFISIACRISLQ